MPFRARLKRALGGGTSNDDYDPSNPLTHGSSKRAKKDYPENTYKPGESMPRPKYRGPWNQAHQDKLSAFSFGNSWSRRRSSTPTNKSKRRNSEYSPMGSKLPSRGPSRRSSNWSTFSAKASKRAWGMGSRQQSGQNVHDGNQQQSVKEAVEGDDDVMNAVGLSRQPTKEDRERPPPPPPKDHRVPTAGRSKQQGFANGHAKENMKLQPLDTQRTITDGQLFTADELAYAMSQSTLRSPKGQGH